MNAKIREYAENRLNAVGVPWKYRVFKAPEVPQNLPLAVWYVDREQHTFSDNRASGVISANLTIELYTADKDDELEEQIEIQLGDSDFLKTEDYNYADEVYQVVYTKTIIIKYRRE